MTEIVWFLAFKNTFVLHCTGTLFTPFCKVGVDLVSARLYEFFLKKISAIENNEIIINNNSNHDKDTSKNGKK